MANFEKSHPLNRPGPLFTDTTCIDCGTCFHLAPELFSENAGDDKSIVIRQPAGRDDWEKAKRSVLSCPTNSIGVKSPPADFSSCGNVLPLKITDDVFYLGYTSRDSYGASAYLIKRKDGNVLVDSPRFNKSLISEIEKAGGIRWMFLTHQDDVADHQKFHDHFKCERIIHEDDLSHDTSNCEKILSGKDDIQLASDLKIIMTPGHSKGHMVLNFSNRYLFTGDHLFVNQGPLKLTASKSVCWYSWEEQIASTVRLSAEKFEWVLPGHGGWGHFSVEDGQQKLQALIQVMKGQS